MDKSIMAIGQAGVERLEALAAGLRERVPGEAFCRRLVQVNGYDGNKLREPPEFMNSPL